MIRYYPSFAVKSNLIANAGEFTLNGKPYSGKYYETFDGKYFSGPNPVLGKNEPLNKAASNEGVPGVTSVSQVSYTNGNDFLLDGQPYVGPYTRQSDGNYYALGDISSANNPSYYPSSNTPDSITPNEQIIVGSDGKKYVKDVNNKIIPIEEAQKQSKDANNRERVLNKRLEPIASGNSPQAISLATKQSEASKATRQQFISTLRINPNFFGVPTSYFPVPLKKDYDVGFIIRYFVKRINEKGYILEISPEEYARINNGTVTYDVSFYQTAEAFWKITGPLNTVRLSQYDIRAGILDANKRTIENLEKTFVGIKAFIGGEYSKFAIATK